MEVSPLSKAGSFTITTDLTPLDFAKAEIQLQNQGREGQIALFHLRQLVGALQELEGSVSLLTISLSFHSSVEPTSLNVSPDAQIGDVLRLSGYTQRALDGGGIKTIGELLKQTKDDLLLIEKFGESSLVEVEIELARVGGQLST